MKAYVVVFVAITIIIGVQALSDEQKEKIRNYHKECSDLTKVNEELVTKARKGEFTNDEKFKEYLFCFSKKAAFQNEAGDIQNDVLKAKLGAEVKNEEETEKLIKKCAVKKETPQDTAYETIKCYYESSPNHASLI